MMGRQSQKARQTKRARARKQSKQKGCGCELNRVTGRCEFVANKRVQSRYCRKPTSQYKCRRNRESWSEEPTLEARARQVLLGLK